MPFPWAHGRVPAVLPIFDPSVARWPLSPTLVALAEAGAEWVQYRDKEASDAEFLAAAREAERLCDSLGMYLMLNDRVTIAAVLKRVGAHVGQTDMPVAKARRLLGQECLGLSTDSLRDLQRAHELPIDYLAVGPVYPTASKPDAGDAIGVAHVGSARRITSLPLVAIGGINATNAGAVTAAGADCVAVLSAVVAVEDPVAAAAAILESATQGLRQRNAEWTPPAIC